MSENGKKLKLFGNLLISSYKDITAPILQNVKYLSFQLVSDNDHDSEGKSCVCYLSFGTELHQFNTSIIEISEILQGHENIFFINVSNDTKYCFESNNCYNITFESIDSTTFSINDESHHFANSIFLKVEYFKQSPAIQTVYWNLFAKSILPIFPNQTIEQRNFYDLNYLSSTSISLVFDRVQHEVLFKKEFKENTLYFRNEAQFATIKEHRFLCNAISVDDQRFFIIYHYKAFESLVECKKMKIVFSEYQKFINITRIIGALSFIHQNEYIHGDIKPGNIFVDSKLLFYLGDFDFCQSIKSPKRQVSRSMFQDPDQETDEHLVRSIDIYSLALLIWFLYEELESLNCIKSKITSIKQNRKLDSSNVPAFWADIVNQCIQLDKAQRPTAESIEEICIPSQLRNQQEFCDIIEALNENSELFVQIGNYYFDGGQFDKAKYFYELAASLHQQEGFYRLGMWYKKIEKDYGKAETYFELASNHSMALYQLGKIYTKGKGMNIDHQIALDYFKQSLEVDKDNSKAMNWMGILYLQGHDIQHDVNKAMYWFRQASALGNPTASYNIKLVHQRHPQLFPTKKRKRSLSLKWLTRNKTPNVTSSSRPRRTSNVLRWRDRLL